MGKFPLAAAEPGEGCGGSRCARGSGAHGRRSPSPRWSRTCPAAAAVPGAHATGEGMRCRGWTCPWAAGGKRGAHLGAHREGKHWVRGCTCTPAYAEAEKLVSGLASLGCLAGTQQPKAVMACVCAGA